MSFIEAGVHVHEPNCAHRKKKKVSSDVNEPRTSEPTWSMCNVSFFCADRAMRGFAVCDGPSAPRWREDSRFALGVAGGAGGLAIASLCGVLAIYINCRALARARAKCDCMHTLSGQRRRTSIAIIKRAPGRARANRRCGTFFKPCPSRCKRAFRTWRET